jgi:hypothetical protein
MKRSLEVLARTHRHVFGIVLGLGVLMGASPALASATFPAAVKAAVPTLSCVPQCTLCHNTTAGGPGNLKPGGLGEYLKKNFDLIPGAEGTVKGALDADRASGHDGDGDGTPDIAELDVDRDPNNPDPNAFICGSGADSGPQYGCGAGARIAQGDAIDGVASLAAGAALAVGITLLRRRSRRH